MAICPGFVISLSGGFGARMSPLVTSKQSMNSTMTVARQRTMIRMSILNDHERSPTAAKRFSRLSCQATAVSTSTAMKPTVMEAEECSVAADLRSRILELYVEFLNEDGTEVNYEGLSKSREFQDYKAVAAELRYVNLEIFEKQERMAFFLNVYNALLIHAMVDRRNLPPNNLLDRSTFYNNARYNIGGNIYSLNDIQNGILRSNRKGPEASAQVPFGLNDPRLRHVVDSPPDGRVHFALACGAKSCPPVRFFCSSNLNSVRTPLLGTQLSSHSLYLLTCSSSSLLITLTYARNLSNLLHFNSSKSMRFPHRHNRPPCPFFSPFCTCASPPPSVGRPNLCTFGADTQVVTGFPAQASLPLWHRVTPTSCTNQDANCTYPHHQDLTNSTLMRAAFAFVRNEEEGMRIHDGQDKPVIEISTIFKWYKEDFSHDGSDAALLETIYSYTAPNPKLQQRLRNAIDNGATIRYMRYDWSLNEAPSET